MKITQHPKASFLVFDNSGEQLHGIALARIDAIRHRRIGQADGNTPKKQTFLLRLCQCFDLFTCPLLLWRDDPDERVTGTDVNIQFLFHQLLCYQLIINCFPLIITQRM